MQTMTGLGSRRQRMSLLNVFYHILLLWTKEMDALANFSNYLLRIIKSQSARACDGDQLRLFCPRHSSVSVQSAFYGAGGALRCADSPWAAQDKEGHRTCTAVTALQKVLSECQGHRDCQLPVNPHVFGRDPCPGTPKNLQVSYKCKPTEHKRKTGCQAEKLTLHCKSPRLLNIYWAAYGRQLGDADTCASEEGEPPLFECSYHGAVDIVSRECYGKQRCVITVDDHNFKDPCPPGMRKQLTVLYACVPLSLMKEADPSIFTTILTPKQTTEKVVVLYPKGSKHPENKGIILSNSLMVFGFIKEHPELAALLFVSSVCVGLLCVLLALSMKISCNVRPLRGVQSMARQHSRHNSDEESSELSSLVSETKDDACWEVTSTTLEAAELAERIERREQIIQEIWMNAYLNGTSQIWPVSPCNTADHRPDSLTLH
ncbi:protein eva-1 homolog C isoform X1 [Paramormyrops kingsleyae]|uniref:Eva-1 homolog C n=1 Tax=Paramormyrops kingsleyae TaxID=1676925 RepID=A0A3B3QK21_9TELE|nr:protein eva-1 homolog C isoform X1 [Paramormyrops kingsleyae]XP_023661100.1 protein eva-1 homolog C isoform X1 [Paramormyrops kingsleyae]